MLKNPTYTALQIAMFSCLCMMLVCCHTTPAPPAGRPVNTANSAILRKLQGSWISYDYTRSLLESRSPYHSAAHIDGLLSFVCDSMRESQDTLYLSALLKGVEDNTIWIYLGQADSTGRHTAGQVTSDRDAAPGDIIVGARVGGDFVTIYTAASDSTRFVYYDGVYRERRADYLLKHHTTTSLFAGSYSTPDSPQVFGSSHITFDPQHWGRITGSPVYDSFDINIDVLAQKDTLDYMEFFDTHGRSESRSYSYRIRDNTIRITPPGDGAPCRLTKVVALADTTAAAPAP